MNLGICVAQAANNATSTEDLLLSPDLATVLSVAALIVCVGCISLVILWGRRLQESAFQRPSLVEALTEQEAKFREADLADRVGYEPLHPLEGELAQFSSEHFWANKNYILSYDKEKDKFIEYPGEDTAETAERRKGHEKHQKAMETFRKWGEEEVKLYEREKRKIRDIAREKADSRIPKVMDVSLLGGGFSFILEFSTVIVIIFSIVILGVVGILEGREIATILAAIAGYVLGKATGFLPSSKEQAQPEQQKTEELNKKIKEQEEKIAEQGKLVEEQKKQIEGDGPKKRPTG
jgi:hypothetical protein